MGETRWEAHKKLYMNWRTFAAAANPYCNAAVVLPTPPLWLNIAMNLTDGLAHG